MFLPAFKCVKFVPYVCGSQKMVSDSLELRATRQLSAAMWGLRIKRRPILSLSAARALNLEAITPAPFNVHPHLIQPITSCSIHGPTLSNPYNFSHGLHQDAQALSLISRITFSRPTTCAHGSTKISAPRDSWGSDQGPQCSNSSHEEPQLQLIVVL